jgi:hypothetical protein
VSWMVYLLWFFVIRSLWGCLIGFGTLENFTDFGSSNVLLVGFGVDGGDDGATV